MKTAKSLYLLNNNSNNSSQKNKSFQSVPSQSHLIRTPHFNHTVLNYVQKRLSEMNNISKTPKQVRVTPFDNEKQLPHYINEKINPPMIVTNNNHMMTKRINEAKPLIYLEVDKTKFNDILNKYTQRSKSRENSEVFVLKKENKKLKEEIGIYRSQLSQLERRMNEYIKNESNRNVIESNNRYSNQKDRDRIENSNNNNNNNNDNDMENNTINSLSVSFEDDEKQSLFEFNTKQKKKGVLCDNLNINNN